MYKERMNLVQKSNWAILPYNIIISDLHMPTQSGFEAANIIINLFKKAIGTSTDPRKMASSPKFILHSGDPNPAMKEAVENNTALSFLYKPAST
jgi:CheY-like chemotaxis protein